MAEERRKPKQSDEALVRAAMDALRRIVRSLRLAAGDVERNLGISVAQLFVLEQLADGRPRSVNEIAAQTLTDPSTVSGVMRHLIDAKLVHRAVSQADGRRAEVSLTARGAELLARAPDAPQAALLEALAALPQRRRRALAAGLVELARRLGGGPPSLFFEEEEQPARRRRR